MNAPIGDAPPHLVDYLRQHDVEAQFLAPGVPMPTVASAAEALRVPEEQILKTLVFVGEDGEFVVAIANGTRRVNRVLLTAACGVPRPRAAAPAVVETVTGFVAGGVAPLGLPAGLRVVVDAVTALLPYAYGGGGREHLLLRVNPLDVIRLNDAIVAPIIEPI